MGGGKIPAEAVPREPWYGYTLGYWPEEFQKEAEDAVNGNYYLTAEKLAKQGTKPD